MPEQDPTNDSVDVAVNISVETPKKGGFKTAILIKNLARDLTVQIVVMTAHFINKILI